jgi:DeoR/GlpR family transcriptional regulator of sugar metabolism
MNFPDVLECLPEERQRSILVLLTEQGRVVASELARKFNTSEDTIRRDLRELAAAGLCKRVYGGALPISPASGSLTERATQNPERKQALAACLVKLIQPEQVVFIDAGSTNLAVVHALPDDLNITVVTNAPSIATVLAERKNIHLILIGGTVNRNTGAALGAQSLRDAGNIRPDLYILGVCALDTEMGLTAFDLDDAEFKRLVASQAKSVVTAITNDKLETTAPFRIAGAEILTALVAEADADGQLLKSLCGSDVQIHWAAAVNHLSTK